MCSLTCSHLVTTGISGNFLTNRIHLNTNATQVVMENSFIADALIYIRFPPGESVFLKLKNPLILTGSY